MNETNILRGRRYGARPPETPQCATCALREHYAYICARWRLAYALNELKKSIPFVRRLAVENMRCPYCYRPGRDHGISTVEREGA